jgi:glutathione S-transferase
MFFSPNKRQEVRLEQAAAAGAAAAQATIEASKGQCRAAALAKKEKNLELIYFDGPGRAELTRLAFTAGGVTFKDTRISQGDWPKVKADATSVPAKCFGSMPCIQHGDNLVAQSQATAVYAAELGIWKEGRLGQTSLDETVNSATEMMVLGAHADLQAAMYKCLFGDDDSKAKGKDALPEAAKQILAGLERALGRKSSTGAFFFCETGPTLADLAVYDFIESPFPGLKALDAASILKDFPKVSAVAEAVAKDPQVAAYRKLKSMGKPELIYFAGPGRAELTRLAFAAGNVDYTDTRHEMSAWPAIKGDAASVPAKMFGSMPCIKHGDAMLAQSQATATYAASLGIWKDGRLGDTAERVASNRATEAMVLGAHADVQAAMYKCLFGDDAGKAKGMEALPGAAAGLLAGLERILERKTCSGPFFFSEMGPTLADLAVYDMIESPFPGLKALKFDVTKFSKVSAVASAVAEDPRIKAYKSA